MFTLSLLAQCVASLKGWRSFVLAVGVGALASCAMAPFHLWVALIVAVPVLVWMLDGVTLGKTGVSSKWQVMARSFGVGWAFGFGFFLAGLYWVGHSFLVEAERYFWLMPFAVVLLPSWLAVFTGLASALTRCFLWVVGPRRTLALAAVWAAFEWLRGYGPFGFPWNLTGQTLGGEVVLMQMLSVVGVYGAGLLVFGLAASPSTLCDPRLEEDSLESTPSSKVWWPVVWFALFAGWGVWGADRLGQSVVAEVNPLTVRIVQPNVLQEEKWQAHRQEEFLMRLLAMTQQSSALPEGVIPSVIIWPEVAITGLLSERPALQSILGASLQKTSVLLTGSLYRQGGYYYNSLFVLNHGGSIIARYDKRHLVPFGEYLPARDVFKAIGLKALAQQRGDFASGEGDVLMTLSSPTPDVPNVPTFRPLICYEIIFPEAIHPTADRASWLLNITNDGWFGTSTGPWQHLDQARFRAVEQGVPVIRAANTGISVVIDAEGRILENLPLNTQDIIDAPLPPARKSTLYGRWGDSLFFALLIGFVLIALPGCRASQALNPLIKRERI
ncbi:MAG: apolipoprotein N-acyltransferase [Parvularculales bacterium]